MTAESTLCVCDVFAHFLSALLPSPLCGMIPLSGRGSSVSPWSESQIPRALGIKDALHANVAQKLQEAGGLGPFLSWKARKQS